MSSQNLNPAQFQKPKAIPNWTTDWDGWVQHLEDRKNAKWMTFDTHDYGQETGAVGKVQN